ncbi:MAG: hypothetical protein KF851_10410 [Pirellulaceae bacterium]|nr:hypothetical protein [Pirellulaceae bacterium]
MKSTAILAVVGFVMLINLSSAQAQGCPGCPNCMARQATGIQRIENYNWVESGATSQIEVDMNSGRLFGKKVAPSMQPMNNNLNQPANNPVRPVRRLVGRVLHQLGEDLKNVDPQELKGLQQNFGEGVGKAIGTALLPIEIFTAPFRDK